VRKLKMIRGSGNIFVDLGFEKIEAENLKLRSDLLMHIHDFVGKSRESRSQTAKKLGLTDRRLSALLRGRIDLFDLDALVDIVRRAGFEVSLEVKKAA
jgi:predicted XRE-type DNA-binding protein